MDSNYDFIFVNRPPHSHLLYVPTKTTNFLTSSLRSHYYVYHNLSLFLVTMETIARLSIYGRSPDEWDKLAEWAISNNVYSGKILRHLSNFFYLSSYIYISSIFSVYLSFTLSHLCSYLSLYTFFLL